MRWQNVARDANNQKMTMLTMIMKPVTNAPSSHMNHIMNRGRTAKTWGDEMVKVGDLVMVEVEGYVYKVTILRGQHAQLRRSTKMGLPETMRNELGGGTFRWVHQDRLKIFKSM